MHIGDPVLAPLAAIALVCHIPVAITLHGLDLTYRNSLYRRWVGSTLHRVRAYIAIGRAVRQLAIENGIPAVRIVIISPGIDASSHFDKTERERNLILYVGRLVARKGLAWFVREVLPRLAKKHPDVQLAVIGSGPERRFIQKIASDAGVTHHVRWLGEVTDSEKMRWYARALICVLPNVPIPGDVEGYGIVALEGAAAGCVVLAADLEGLKDALANGERGRLIPPGDRDAWIAEVERLLADDGEATALGLHASQHAFANAGWETVIEEYCALFDDMLARRFPPPLVCLRTRLGTSVTVARSPLRTAPLVFAMEVFDQLQRAAGCTMNIDAKQSTPRNVEATRRRANQQIVAEPSASARLRNVEEVCILRQRVLKAHIANCRIVERERGRSRSNARSGCRRNLPSFAVRGLYDIVGSEPDALSLAAPKRSPGSAPSQ